MATKKKKRRLGRGLGSMINSPVKVEVPGSVEPSGDVAVATMEPVAAIEDASDGGLIHIPLGQLQPNQYQPRKVFDEAALTSLADSIRTAGVMQPVVVRPAASGGYELVAGERRLRAAEIVGLERIPAVVQDVDDRTAAEWSIIENVQREDLNPMERAEAFQHLQDQFGLTHQEIAEKVGLNRSSVTNHLRLNELDEATKQAVRTAVLSMGHAKAMLAVANLTSRARLLRQCISKHWSVRELERKVRQSSDGSGSKSTKGETEVNPRQSNIEDLQKKLGEHLGTRVQIQQQARNPGRGRLVIEFFDLDQFDGLLGQMGFNNS
ncbi:MAG: ParB/RepB/Spo0J family partition protein [Phycisphaerales bacterium]|nr:ParB/RepB/Spo0J family partition protein [Phycisphaerales bacterium]